MCGGTRNRRPWDMWAAGGMMAQDSAGRFVKAEWDAFGDVTIKVAGKEMDAIAFLSLKDPKLEKIQTRIRDMMEGMAYAEVYGS